uniref:Ulp1 protease family, C-terminal catalytic domain containing protein n=1 Tax=Solanum tuberosum TaxID=4113 RepID=M1BHR8_SOLTU
MDHPSFNIGIFQIITPNNDRIFDYEDLNWAELTSKRLHDPAIMANQSSKKRKSKKEVIASSRAKDAKTQKKRGRKVAPPISRPTLPMNMKYEIEHIPKHSLKFGLTYNSNFNEDLVLSIKDEEVEQDNLDKEIHIRHAKGNVLRFSIREFAIITDLKCKENIKDFTNPDSITSRLVQRYFSGQTYHVNKERLVDEKIGALEALIKKNHSELVKAVGAKDNKSDKDSTISASISSGTEAVIDALVYKLQNEPIHVESLSVIIPLQLTGSDDFLSDSQLPTQLPVKESAHNLDTKTPAPRNRMPSKIMQSPYLIAFGSSDKARGK